MPTPPAQAAAGQRPPDDDFFNRVSRFKFPPFDPKEEEWRYYISRFETELKLQRLMEDDSHSRAARRNLFLKCIGPELYRLVIDHFAPTPIDQKLYRDIKTFLNAYFQPTTNYLLERMKFGQCFRQAEQTVSQYLSQLRKMAVGCSFGESLEERLRDQFLLGLRNADMQEELFRQHSGVDSKLVDIEKLAIVVEAAQGQRRTLESSTSQGSTISKISTGKPFKGKSTVPFSRRQPNPQPRKESSKGTAPRVVNPNTTCLRCGKEPHAISKCPAKDSKCHACQQIGHWDVVCISTGRAIKQKGKRKPPARANAVSSDKQGYLSDVSAATRQSSRDQRYLIKVIINGKKRLTMEFDTAAFRTIISKDTWEALGSPPLAPTANLGAYPNFTIPMLGETTVDVSLGNSTQRLQMAVTKQANGIPLFGKDWIQAFKLEPKSEHITYRTVAQVQPPVTQIAKQGDRQAAHSDPDVAKLFQEYADIFSDKPGVVKGHKVALHLHKDAQPKVFKPRPVPFSIRAAADGEINRLVQDGIIEPVDPAVTAVEWASPVVYVPKPNGQVRMCADFKVTINKHMIVDPHPLPRFEEIITTFQGFTEFSVIDLKDAFLQLELDERSKNYTTIATHRGYYRYNRLPFGASSSPSLFQHYMDKLLSGIDGVVCMMDDIATGGRNRAEHLHRVRLILNKFRQVGLRTQMAKLRLLQPEVKYLGHRIDKDGIHPTAERIEAIRNQPSPRNVQELRSFLGSINYNARFIPNLQSKCVPLHRLLQKGTKWEWTQEDEAICNELKADISSENTLVHYDPDLPLILATDASERGVGAILMHRFPNGSERPIAAASRSLTAAESRYAPIDREALGILFGVGKFHQYLYGRKFTLRTDHKPLERVFGEHKEIPKMAASRLTRWAITLSAYNYEIEYTPGKENSAADALSRLPLPSTRGTELESSDARAIGQIRKIQLEALPLTRSRLRKRTISDPVLGKVIAFVQRGWPEKKTLQAELIPFYEKRNELSFEDNLLIWQDRIVIPSLLRRIVLAHLHDGHPGIAAMRAMARHAAWWPHVDDDIETMIKTCIPCQQNRVKEPETPISPWNIPDGPWERIHIDFTGPFEGQQWFIVIDAYSRWLEIFPMATPTTERVIKCLRQLICRYGFCKQIVSDNGSYFTSDNFRQFCKSNGITHIRSTPYHSRTNGMVERVIQTFKRHFRMMEDRYPDKEHRLQGFLWSYRIHAHSSTGRTPAELFLGRKPMTIFDRLKPDVRGNMDTARTKQKFYHDQHTTARSFYMGDPVWVSTDGSGWIAGIVKKQTAPLSYIVEMNGMDHRRHADQMRLRHVDSGAEDSDNEETVAQETLPPGKANQPRSEWVSKMTTEKFPLQMPIPEAQQEKTKLAQSQTQEAAATSKQTSEQAAKTSASQQKRGYIDPGISKQPATQETTGERRYPVRESRKPPDRYKPS